MQRAYQITFIKGYIAHPYWPQRERLINIQKESGTKRVRSEEKRVKVLRDYLATKGMSMADYEALEQEADRQFYTAADLDNADGHDITEIVIPAHQIYGMAAQACGLASSSIRIARAENLRTVLTVSDIFTGKHKADGVWERFVVVTAGAGNKLSNQRALRSNEFVGPFTATFEVKFSEEVIDPKKVDDFLGFCGREIGVGASRKLGWGRFEIGKAKAK
jgi:hypothetical protein